MIVAMYIDIVPNRNSKPAILLRESYREDGKVKKRTLANLSHFPIDQVDTLSRALKGEKLVPVNSLFIAWATFRYTRCCKSRSPRLHP